MPCGQGKQEVAGNPAEVGDGAETEGLLGAEHGKEQVGDRVEGEAETDQQQSRAIIDATAHDQQHSKCRGDHVSDWQREGGDVGDRQDRLSDQQRRVDDDRGEEED